MISTEMEELKNLLVVRCLACRTEFLADEEEEIKRHLTLGHTNVSNIICNQQMLLTLTIFV